MPRSAVTNRFRQRDFMASLLFNGTTSTLVVPHNANQLLTSGMTLAAWIKPLSIGENSQGMIFNKTADTSATSGYYLSMQTNDRINFRVNASTSRNCAVNAVPAGRWSHVMVTAASDGTCNFYVNGSLSGTANQATTALSGITTTNDLTIGNRSGATDRTFDGYIDEACIWNRVLTAQEISDLYYLGSVSTSGLVSYYRLNEGAGSTANDGSPSPNNGTITSATFSADVPMKSRKASVNANMVKNGDFEYAPPFTAATSGTGRWIDGTAAGSASNSLFGWSMPSAPTGTCANRFDSSVFHSGSNSLKVSTLATGSSCTASSYLSNTPANQIASGFPALPNTTYVITYWVKTQVNSGAATSGAGLVLREQGVTGSTITTNVGTKVNTTTDWTQYTITVTTNASTRYFAIDFNVKGDDGAATLIMDAWLDDIVLLPAYPEGRVPANGNLVKNFDFEVAPTSLTPQTTSGRWFDGTAAGSTVNNTYKLGFISKSGTGEIALDTISPHGGLYSLRVSTTAVSSNVEASNIPATSVANMEFAIPVIPSTSYTGTFWMRTNYVSGDATNGANLDFITRNAAGTALTVNSSTKVKTTTGWTQYTIVFTSDATARYVTWRARVDGLTGAPATLIMDAWFDDIYLAPTTNPGRVAIT